MHSAIVVRQGSRSRSDRAIGLCRTFVHLWRRSSVRFATLGGTRSYTSFNPHLGCTRRAYRTWTERLPTYKQGPSVIENGLAVRGKFGSPRSTSPQHFVRI